MATDSTAEATPRSAHRPIDVPWELNVPIADLYIVGYGMRLPNDLTLETLAILKRCKRLFGVPPINASSFGIPQMEDLSALYAPGKPRMKTYAEMTEQVLKAAADDPPVAFATYGSAMVGTFPAHRLLEEAPRRGLTVHATNAVSSFDGLWADFNVEPFYGCQIWEASAFVDLDVVPDTKAILLLPQAPIYGIKTGMDAERMRTEPRREMSKLKTYLQRFYPAEHVVYLAMTSGASANPLRSIVTPTKLEDLDAVDAPLGATLVVPRLDDAAKRFDFEGRATSDVQPAYREHNGPDAARE